MTEIDKILQILAENQGGDASAQDVRDLVSNRPRFAAGGTLDERYNVRPVDGGFNDITVMGSNYGRDLYNDILIRDLLDQIARENIVKDTSLVGENDPNAPTGDEIVVTAQTTAPPPTFSDFNSYWTDFNVDGYDPNAPTDNEIVAVAPRTTAPPDVSFTPTPPIYSESPENEIVAVAPRTTAPPDVTLSHSVTLSTPPISSPPSENEIVVVAPKTTAPPNVTLSFSLDVPFVTDPEFSTRPPGTSRPPATSTIPPVTLSTPPLTGSFTTTVYRPTVQPTVSLAQTPALTWNPNLTSGQVGFPSEYRPLQHFNLPNYANVYDLLFEGQGHQSPLGQSMLVPPDQGSRLDTAMAVAQQAQQQPAPQPVQQAAGAGKARGGSVNDTIDGIIAYLQSIRR